MRLPTARVAPQETCAVRIGVLEKSYVEGGQTHAVLAGADARIERGETVVLLGRSGSGKSTLLNLVAGIDLPDSGYVELEGTRITALTERERTLFRRRRLGFIYQFFNLLPTLTVAENVRLPLELNGAGRREAEISALSLLEEVGLARRANAFPDVLSGGEQQRVAIARALVHDPVLVLADEPTGNLDEATGHNVLALLDRLVRQRGGTMLLATHSRTIADAGDRVWRLHEGRLQEEAPAA
jgi:putative ABC transport system ATP-binding protein